MPSPGRPGLEYRYAAGALWIARGRNVWRLTGEDAARLYACARSVEARGLSPGRVLGRALRGRYLMSVERQAKETAGEERARAIRDDAGDDVVAMMAVEVDKRG